jgi:peptidoglycan/xylan/chitin deacetylase (PgdA/CDA1 family)
MESAMSETASFAWPDGQRAALSLSFDDARPSQLDRGIPLLDARGVRGTFYVSIGRLEERRAEWRAAAERGHEIANHSLTHPCSGNFSFARSHPLENYSLEQMERELLEASDAIERLVGTRPSTFAYPCGQAFVGRGEETRSYVPLVAKHFVVGRAGFNEIHNDPAFCDLAQATGMMMDDLPFEALRAMLDAAIAAGGWLILAGHDVGEGGRQTTIADALDALCRYATDDSRGVWVDTVAAIGQYIAATRQGVDS